MSTSTLLENIKEVRRDALVSDYINNVISDELKDKITDEDTLYEYLLLDTKVSGKIKTSPIAEAISSTQLYINRCIEGYEGELDSKANSYFSHGNFLDNWDTYNKRYSTWAGKERLKYYAGSYIDPSLRYNKTDLFKDLENTLSQGKINEDNVKNAIQNYLTQYEILSELEYISVCKGNDETELFFIGRTKTTPCEYYWRKLTLKKDNDNKLIPFIWYQWKKITCNISNASSNYVVPYWEDNKLHIQWITEEDKSSKLSFILNDWVLNSSEVWTSFDRYPMYNIYQYEEEDKRVPFEYISIDEEGIITVYDPKYYKYTMEGRSDDKLNLHYIWNNGNAEVQALGTVNGYISVGKYYEFTLKEGIKSDKVRIFDGVSNIFSALYPEYFIVPFNYSYGSFSKIQYNPPSGSSIKGPIDLKLANNIDLSILLRNDFKSLFDYNLQDVDHLGGIEAFNGPYGTYLWEIFFHIPFFTAVRFQMEQRYEEAECWFKFIFSSNGYRDEDGNLLTDGDGDIRYWNVVPLQEDNQWDETLSLSTVDPDEIAMADPMHYKLAIFIHTLDFLIDRGDNLYRMLERDTLTEAKMYYIQAKQLLGPRPEFRINNSWTDPTLKVEANDVTADPKISISKRTPTISLYAYLKEENGDFLPPYNEDLLTYWDKIDIRLYNLRNNLNLDGQPLYLPLFAEPANPRDLQKQYSAGDGLEGSIASSKDSNSIYRFPVVIEKARTAVNSLIEFGSSLGNALEKQDSEAMTLLLQSQQKIIAGQTLDVQKDNIMSLQESLQGIMKAKSGAESRKKYYEGLLENWMSPQEIASLALRSTSAILNTSSIVPIGITGAVDMAPNIFGFACGGSRWGAVSSAVAQGLQVSAGVLDQTANIIDITENYRRRKEEWTLQKDIADNEEQQLESQIASLQHQIDMANKQLIVMETEQANAEAIYELQSTRFTSQALYNWMVGRLSSLYYQLYDLTLPLCLLAKKALEREMGDEKTTNVFTLPAWSDLYQGLLTGEALIVELQKLDNLWMEESKRGLEATKTVSVDNIIKKENQEISFVDEVRKILSGDDLDEISGVNIDLENGIFSTAIDMSTLELDNSYNLTEKVRRIKNISVTLPALLGPYQDIEATLSLGNETVALSHGMDDSGLFVTDFNDSRFLPFEGMDLLTGKLVLTIFHTGEGEEQRSLLESLTDIIFHIRYVIK